MLSSLVLTAMAANLVAADRLVTYLGGHCTNANLDVVEPLELGSCIEFGQAQSYILHKDDDSVYNLYSGGGCGQYEGQVSFAKGCLTVGDGITGIINIAKQDFKRAAVVERRKQKEQRARITTDVVKRVDGDSWQCPNIPSGAYYFFVVSHSSATEDYLPGSDQTMVTNNFMREFNAAYQNPSGQTRATAYTPYAGGNFGDIQMTLEMEQGVIQDIQPQDMEALTNDLFEFRRQQRGPVDFLVSLYTGRLDTNNIGGMIGTFRFDGLD